MGPLPPSDGKEYILVAVDYGQSGSRQSPLLQTIIGNFCDSSHDASSPDTVVQGPSSAAADHISTTLTSRRC